MKKIFSNLNFRKALSFVLASAGVVVAFQNCGRMDLSGVQGLSLSSSTDAGTVPDENSPTASMQVPEYNVRLSDRRYIENILTELTSGPIATSGVAGRISGLVSGRKADFTGGCDPNGGHTVANANGAGTGIATYNFECSAQSGDAAHMAPGVAAFSSGRAAMTMRVCSAIYSEDAALKNTLSHVGYSTDFSKFSEVTVGDIQKVFSLFYGDMAISDELVKSVQGIYQGVDPKLTGPDKYREEFRLLVEAVCASPQWQIL